VPFETEDDQSRARGNDPLRTDQGRTAEALRGVLRAGPGRPPAPPAPEGLVIGRLAPEASFKDKAYAALKDAIASTDVYDGPDPIWLDERELSVRLGVSRTPIREAMAMLEQEGFVRIVPRRGILVARKTKREIVEMIQAWAALEGMAVRLIALNATGPEIASLRDIFRGFDAAHTPRDHLDEYDAANVAFHGALIRLSGSQVIAQMTDNLRLHVRAIRHRTIFERDRAAASLGDHIAIIEALEARDAEAAERLARDHTLRLATYVEEHVDLD
jgi:DNA-binding GntR family transcriptional regulator